MISTLYIIYDPNKSNIYKIGEITDLDKRMKQYKTYIYLKLKQNFLSKRNMPLKLKI